MGLSLFAVHLGDGVLSDAWIACGFALAAAMVGAAMWRLREEDIPRIGVLSAAFFVASSIHIKLAVLPTSVHLILNGLVGVVLGRVGEAPEHPDAADELAAQRRVVVEDADDAVTVQVGREHLAGETARAEEQHVGHAAPRRSAASRRPSTTRSWSASVSSWYTGRISVLSVSRSVAGSGTDPVSTSR